jgi:hypothetical protein
VWRSVTEEQVETPIVFAERGVEAPPTRRAGSYLGYDPREDEWPEAFAFCPECAEREFGDEQA